MTLPVGQWRRNIEYYSRLSDEQLLLKHKEATAMWLQVIATEDRAICSKEYSLDTIEFWQDTMNSTEELLRERGLI